MRIMFPVTRLQSRFSYALLFLVFCLFLSHPLLAAEPPKAWSFAAIADNRAADERPAGSYEGVLNEIRDMKLNPKPAFPPIEFVLACGDVKTSADDAANWKLFLATFKDAPLKPAYFPLIGNWDDGDAAFNRKTILPAQKGVVGTDPEKYYVDWKNVRLIVSRDRDYVEKNITAAPESIDHVFVADHYPIFARHAHTQPVSKAEKDFWTMLVKHNDRVRAFFVGHTHWYSRIRVADPAGPAADESKFPDEDGGVYQIDCGNAGRTSGRETTTTLVEILVDGKSLSFRTLQADNKAPSDFRLADEWKIIPAPPAP